MTVAAALVSLASAPSLLAAESAQDTALSRQVPMFGYGEAAGPVEVQFRGTPLAPKASGQGQFAARKSQAGIKAEFTGLPPATQFGSPYVTYVLWAVTPAGRARNLSEITVNGSTGKVDAKAAFKAFGLIVTAEPDFAVSEPSELVVLEGEPPAGAVSTATCELVSKDRYPPRSDPAVPAPPPGVDAESALALEEARYALFLARRAGAERYAPQTLSTGEQLLKQAEMGAAANMEKKTLDETARAATLIAEDARVLALRRRANQAEQPTGGDGLP